ncbi:hypothetical protein [Demequina rhizosphaerae]|uniref:hypothetical protein n=1 Tax=Demequina rhizosphaerae TaxID=1638985 RepID=UPI000785D950|nr:hypothetical protein [Demequina rhizosphaerae]
MTSLEDMMRDRERAIASGTDVPTATTIGALGSAARRRRRTRSAIAAGAAVAAVGVIGGVGALALGARADAPAPAAPTSSASPSPSASAVPGPTASASPSAEPSADPDLPEAQIVPGYAPVPQLSAEAIPWGEVGPGWFVVALHDDVDPQTLFADQVDPWDPAVLPAYEGSLSLVSPAGDWYAARTLDELGSGLPLAWDGANLWTGTTVHPGSEHAFYDIDLVSVETGAPAGSMDRVPWELAAPFAPGEALVYAWGGEGLANVVASADPDGAGACSDLPQGFFAAGWEPRDRSFLYSPVDGGRIVCFAFADDSSRTRVWLVDVDDVARSELLAEFAHPATRYSFVGWIDDDTFFFARRPESGPGAEALFRYDLRDGSITEVDASIYADVHYRSTEGYFHRASQRHIVTSLVDGGWEVALYGLDGSPVATIEGVCPSDDRGQSSATRTSGDRLLVTCPTDGDVAMYDLGSGAAVGSWDVGTGRILQAFDHPDR